MNPTCETCKWWERGPSETTGQCHRYPPTLPMINGPIELRDFPSTAYADWCGEHSPQFGTTIASLDGLDEDELDELRNAIDERIGEMASEIEEENEDEE